MRALEGTAVTFEASLFEVEVAVVDQQLLFGPNVLRCLIEDDVPLANSVCPCGDVRTTTAG